MKIYETSITDAFVLEPKVFGDSRGYFFESFNMKKLHKKFKDIVFVQDNISFSEKGVLRGMHFQKEFPQGKLIQAIKGKILDVIVDLREGSSSFGKYYSIELSDQNKKQLWAPPGVAHGFCVLSDSAKVFYKCTEYYHPEDEYTLLWCDPDIGIEWPFEDPVLSDKDIDGYSFEHFKSMND